MMTTAMNARATFAITGRLGRWGGSVSKYGRGYPGADMALMRCEASKRLGHDPLIETAALGVSARQGYVTSSHESNLTGLRKWPMRTRGVRCGIRFPSPRPGGNSVLPAPTP